MANDHDQELVPVCLHVHQKIIMGTEAPNYNEKRLGRLASFPHEEHVPMNGCGYLGCIGNSGIKACKCDYQNYICFSLAMLM